MLSGSRVSVLTAPDDALLLRPPRPQEAIGDVGAAVRDSLRFPLSGPPLEALATRGGTATLVVEPPALPLPGAPVDPRQAALEATIGELERLGIPSQRQTLLVAGGLERRAGAVSSRPCSRRRPRVRSAAGWRCTTPSPTSSCRSGRRAARSSA